MPSMVQLSVDELHNFLLGLNSALYHNYFYPLTIDEPRAPRKEVIKETKLDLELILDNTTQDDRGHWILKARKYAAIVP